MTDTRQIVTPGDPEDTGYSLEGIVAVIAQAEMVEPDAGVPDREAYQHGLIVLLDIVRSGIRQLRREAMGNVEKIGEAR